MLLRLGFYTWTLFDEIKLKVRKVGTEGFWKADVDLQCIADETGGRTDLELGICVSGIVAWLGSRWDGIKTFSSVFWHFTSSILIPLLNSVHYSAGDVFTALLLYLTLQGLCSLSFDGTELYFCKDMKQ